MPLPPRPTHFLCLPLVTAASLPQLTASLALFRQDPAIQLSPVQGPARRQQHSLQRSSEPEDGLIDLDGVSGPVMPIREAYVPVKAVRPVGTLHLTLGVMRLESKERIEEASNFLRALDLDIELRQSREHDGTGKRVHSTVVLNPSSSTATQQQIQQGKLEIQLKGLHAMQQAQKTRVLYAEPVDSLGRLLPFCQRLQSKFVQAGFLIDEGRDLKLHATVVNTIYAPKQNKGAKGKKTIEFDASDIIERWKDRIWAEISIGKVAICEMGAKEDAEGEVRYVEVAEKVFE